MVNMNRLGREHLADMSDEGSNVRARRERLGMDKKALAAEAGVNRNTLTAIEAGESFNRTTLAKIERALSRLEDEAGIDAPVARATPGDEDIVEFRVEGVLGVHSVVVKGPIRDIERFEDSIARILRQVQQGETNAD
jgi:transcriptional regulator with XRE-family HTH domain